MKRTKDRSYWSAEDLTDQEIVTISGEVTEEDGEFGKRLVAMVRRGNGEEAKLKFNSTSKNNLIDAFGDDDEKWVMKDIRVHIQKNQKVGSKFVDVIYVSHPNRNLRGEEINA